MLERFCQRTLVEVERVISDSSSSYHERYLALYGLVQKEDKTMAFVFNDLRRSNAILNLVAMQSCKLMTPDEFSEFSDETQNILNSFQK